MWGASLAGIAFGNSGTHLPHAMSYGVTHLMANVRTAGYPVAAPFVPHGISVIVGAPSIFRYTAEGAPERHLEAAALLGADATAGATPEDAGEVLAGRLVELMRATGMPNGLRGIGFDASRRGRAGRVLRAPGARDRERAPGVEPRGHREHVPRGALVLVADRPRPSIYAPRGELYKPRSAPRRPHPS